MGQWQRTYEHNYEFKPDDFDLSLCFESVLQRASLMSVSFTSDSFWLRSVIHRCGHLICAVSFWEGDQMFTRKLWRLIQHSWSWTSSSFAHFQRSPSAGRQRNQVADIHVTFVKNSLKRSASIQKAPAPFQFNLKKLPNTLLQSTVLYVHLSFKYYHNTLIYYSFYSTTVLQVLLK